MVLRKVVGSDGNWVVLRSFLMVSWVEIKESLELGFISAEGAAGWDGCSGVGREVLGGWIRYVDFWEMRKFSGEYGGIV